MLMSLQEDFIPVCGVNCVVTMEISMEALATKQNKTEFTGKMDGIGIYHINCGNFRKKSNIFLSYANLGF